MATDLFGQPVREVRQAKATQQAFNFGVPDIPYSSGNWLDAGRACFDQVGLTVRGTEQPNYLFDGERWWEVVFDRNGEWFIRWR